MVNWTCCECGHSFNEMTGEIDERMCYNCLDGYDEPYDFEALDSLMTWAIKKLQSDPIVRLGKHSPKCCEV